MMRLRYGSALDRTHAAPRVRGRREDSDQIAWFSCSRRSECPGIPYRREQDLLVSLENAALAVIDLRGNNEPRYLEGGLEWSGSSHGSDSATRWD
jgi:hypothetical protein